MTFQQVTKETIFRQLDQLPPNRLMEVAQFIEFLQSRTQQPARRKSSRKYSAFGIWADYPEAQNPVEFASKLRQQL